MFNYIAISSSLHISVSTFVTTAMHFASSQSSPLLLTSDTDYFTILRLDYTCFFLLVSRFSKVTIFKHPQVYELKNVPW